MNWEKRQPGIANKTEMSLAAEEKTDALLWLFIVSLIMTFKLSCYFSFIGFGFFSQLSMQMMSWLLYSQAKYSLTSLFSAASGIHLPFTQAKGEEEVSSPNNYILDLFVGMVIWSFVFCFMTDKLSKTFWQHSTFAKPTVLAGGKLLILLAFCFQWGELL